MINPERDLRTVEAMVVDLKPYLLSNVLYWQLSDSRPGYPLPRGTLGGMFLRDQRLEAIYDDLSMEQRERLEYARSGMRAELAHWVVQAEMKVQLEVKARIRGWRIFLSECEDNPRRYQDEYPTQVGSRTIIQLFDERLPRAVRGRGLMTQVSYLDGQLLRISTREGFVWDERLQSAFPETPYWWLYVLPVPEDQRIDPDDVR
ncbi:MAG: hypothetical protein GYB68_17225 [Chloroflexi bacterium]|nr:hypothetical protein [Chloroflexota bacterium]